MPINKLPKMDYKLYLQLSNLENDLNKQVDSYTYYHKCFFFHNSICNILESIENAISKESKYI